MANGSDSSGVSEWGKVSECCGVSEVYWVEGDGG